jgi:hypothetical protein
MELQWNKISEVGLPEEFQPKYSKDGHTESVTVLVFDSFYGFSLDRLWNGEWVSDRRLQEGNIIEPAVFHQKLAWAYIPYPDGIDSKLFKKLDANGVWH